MSQRQHTLQRKTTFAFDVAIKRSKRYLERTGKQKQARYLPDRYPQQLTEQLDIAVRAKILKAHLKDAFAENTFSVKITREKNPAITILSDCTNAEEIASIADAYTKRCFISALKTNSHFHQSK
jgi:hypothetical protein